LSELSDSQIAAKEHELFELVDLTGRQHEPVRRYSKGMRQRLGLAQALLHDPDLLILDEPTDGLDPMGRSQIRDLLSRLKERGKTVFLNSHILQEVELICDRVAVMALGELRGMGTIEHLIQQNPMAQRGTVHVDVPSTTKNVETILAEFQIQAIKPIVNNEVLTRIEIAAPHQADVDKIVDILRQNQIGIVRLERYRPSLEQVFMSIVGSAPPHLR
jgi:ABC-2 type transport system ATP-binding protein